MTQQVPILMYHSVTHHPPAATRSLSVRPTDLEWQLRHLRDNGFTGLTFTDLCVRTRTGAPLPARPIVLTFDDGYADTHEQALPLLREHGFPATVFVTTGWLRDAGPWAAGDPLDRTMVWSQVKELHDSGIEVAAHSHSHAQLDQLEDGPLHDELSLGKKLLEERLDRPVPSIAYPYGYWSRRVRDAVEGAGYDQAAAVANAASQPGRNVFAMPRLTVRRSTAPNTFARIAACADLHRVFALDRALTNGYSLVRRSRRALRKATP
jgi:peptidoglycan/xylan/chitin deacetylase (PgdA/CDA1 family)